MPFEVKKGGGDVSRFPYSAEVPIVIGGVGGSGTRLIAQCLKELGYFMGSDLNESNDNLLFTLLFKRLEVLSLNEEQFTDLLTIFYRGMMGDRRFTRAQKQLVASLVGVQRNKLTPQWLQQRAQALFDGKQEADGNQFSGLWGWKEPSAHVVLDRLRRYAPGMKYIHVVRNGLDMAYSENQNQLALWGQTFLKESVEITPQFSLKYWCAVHRRVLEIGSAMGPNFLLLNYDNFCTGSERGVKELCTFLGVEAADITQLAGLIRVPESIGRFREGDLSVFDSCDIDYVGQLGFDVGL